VTPGADGAQQLPGTTLEPVPSADPRQPPEPRAVQLSKKALGTPEGAEEPGVEPVTGDPRITGGLADLVQPRTPAEESQLGFGEGEAPPEERETSAMDLDRIRSVASRGSPAALDHARGSLMGQFKTGQIDLDDPIFKELGIDLGDITQPDPSVTQALAAQGFEGEVSPDNPEFQQWAESKGVDPERAFRSIMADSISAQQANTPRGQAKSAIDSIAQGITYSGPFNQGGATAKARTIAQRMGMDFDAFDLTDPESLGSFIQSGVDIVRDLGAGGNAGDPDYKRMKNLMQQVIIRKSGTPPGGSLPPEASLALSQMWKALGDAAGRDMSHLDARIRFNEKIAGQEGATDVMASRISDGGFQNLQGTTLGFGTGQDLERGFATGSGPLGSLNKLVQRASQQVATGPNRQQLAEQAFTRLGEATAPQFQQELRGVGQRAAALGRVGAGLTTSDLGTVQQRREEFLGRARAGLSGEAAGRELGDRVASLNALLGSRGQTFNQLFGQEQARLGARQQQQGFQFGQQQSAQENAIRQFLLQQGEQQRQFGNELDLARFNVQGGRGAFGSPEQQFGSPQEQAILQFLAQLQAS
jgi:hypothetical protein